MPKTIEGAYGNELTKAKSPREEWDMPDPPADHSCGNSDIVPRAYLDSGWVLHWSCENCESYIEHIEWPYEEDEWADGDMLEELGFKIV